ncbi:MAG: DUF692 domain-containing protein [Polyangiaceae bacterium]
MNTTNGFENLGIGVGLRSRHYAHILEHEPAVDWFEVLSDNYMHTQGRPLYFLDRIAERYPLVMHGVGLSIGSTDPLDMDYLRELKQLRDRIGARWVSDHVCWTGVSGQNAHDLLPLPYTEQALRHTVERVRRVQDFLGAPLVLENPSSYAEFEQSSMSEAEFIAELVTRADARLLLDVNNVFVSAFNHGFDALSYLRALPLERVVQFHVAGHTHHGTHIVDTHVGPVPNPVWQLLSAAHELGARASVLLEWDSEVPEFDVVHQDALKTRQALGQFAGANAA